MPGLIAHEWIALSGGSEQVFFELASIYPDAALHVLWADSTGPFGGRPLSQSWIARTPLRKSKPLALPLMLPTWRTIAAEEPPDWLLASTHLFAHHARVRKHPDIPKLVYAHTPARYIWAPQHDSRGSSTAARMGAAVLKPIDRLRAQEAISVAANSKFTRERIISSWRRDCEVIYPPVKVAEIQSVDSWAARLSETDQGLLTSLPGDYLLGASRLVSYKRVDLAIRAGEATKMPVVIAGSGPAEATLRDLAAKATVPVHFVPSPDDALLRTLYERASAYVFGAVEDFGIMPVEAMALGTPVVAPQLGGAAESVIDGVTGAFFASESDSALADAVVRAIGCDRDVTRQSALRFDTSIFRAAVVGWMSRNLDTPQSEAIVP